MAAPEEHDCCNNDKLELLARLIGKLTEEDQWPIGKSRWVNDLALVKGEPCYWNGAKWQKL